MAAKNSHVIFDEQGIPHPVRVPKPRKRRAPSKLKLHTSHVGLQDSIGSKQTRYYATPLNVSRVQARKFLRGETIQVKASQFNGSGYHFYLTKQQIKKLNTHGQKGTGSRLHLSNTQIHHIMKMDKQLHGGSLFSWLKGAANTVGDAFKKGYNTVSDNVRRGAKYAIPFAPLIYRAARPYLRPVLNGATDLLTGRLPDFASQPINQGIKQGINVLGNIGGFGLRKKRGGSFLSVSGRS